MKAPLPNAPTDRTRLRRFSEKADYDAATVHAVLDAAPLAHIAYQMNGAPMVLSTLAWREGDRVFWHGSSASRALKAMRDQAVCLSVTTLDGLVLARSAFEHSVQFRSLMVMGQAQEVTVGKEAHLQAMVERLFPGRWDQLRPMQPQEVKATMVMALDLSEASAKIAKGGPTDPDEDRTWPVWAGVVPMALQFGAPLAEPDSAEGAPAPQVSWSL
jgi:nitroimidazol reductase NimA-like FMN-containing flavoprotein (pyridoxamine 5'-phosphate oxidase superfamily)